MPRKGLRRKSGAGDKHGEEEKEANSPQKVVKGNDSHVQRGKAIKRGMEHEDSDASTSSTSSLKRTSVRDKCQKTWKDPDTIAKTEDVQLVDGEDAEGEDKDSSVKKKGKARRPPKRRDLISRKRKRRSKQIKEESQSGDEDDNEDHDDKET